MDSCRKSKRSLADLRDLAVILGASANDLLGTSGGVRPAIAHYWAGLQEGAADGWWGNVGVEFARQKFSKWYPITVRQATDIGQSLEDVTSESDWITVATLNDRLLLLRPTAIDSICLLDEGVMPLRIH
jgi:hypothetical protein